MVDCLNNTEVLRKIHVIIDPAGGAGKGFIRKFLEYKGIAKCIPHVTEAKHVSAWAFAWPKQAYVLDIPRDRRVHGKRKLEVNTELWAAVEMLKDGRAVETRYKPQDLQLAFSPHIWILTNEVPPWHALSEDRWVPWLICPKTKSLIPWTETRMMNIGVHIELQRQQMKLNVHKAREEWYKQIYKGDDDSKLEWDAAALRVKVDDEDVPPTPPPSPESQPRYEKSRRTECVPDAEGFGLGE